MPLSNNEIKVTPLGGLGQIGSNMCLFEGKDESILIDSGLLFPREGHTGVRYLIPDFFHIDSSKLKAIFISHCHEDHIGALGHLLDFKPRLKIYTEIFTSKVIQRKYRKSSLDIEVINDQFTTSFKNFDVASFRVNHSTANTLGFIVKNNSKSLVFSSDFKVNLTKYRESNFDFKRINEITKGTDIISFIDSTNILKKGKTIEETEVIQNLTEILKTRGRQFITFFPSNIYRFLNIIKICNENNKIPVLYGKAMHMYYQCAQNANLIQDKGYEVQDIENVNPNNENMVFLVSGCQGNFRSTLHNIAQGQSPYFKPKKSDTFIYSASIVPGNDKHVYKIINQFTEMGVNVIMSVDKPIHCSGHPGQEDIKIYLDNVKPHSVVPIHGESYFLKKHHDFIKENYPQINSYLLFNHASLLIKNEIKIIENEPSKPLMVSYNDRIVGPQVISERRKLAENGILIVSISKKDTLLRPIGISLDPNTKQQVLDCAHRYSSKKSNPEELRIKIRKILNTSLGHKPMVEIINS